MKDLKGLIKTRNLMFLIGEFLDGFLLLRVSIVTRNPLTTPKFVHRSVPLKKLTWISESEVDEIYWNIIKFIQIQDMKAKVGEDFWSKIHSNILIRKNFRWPLELVTNKHSPWKRTAKQAKFVPQKKGNFMFQLPKHQNFKELYWLLVSGYR